MSAFLKVLLIGLAVIFSFLVFCKVKGYRVEVIFKWYDFWVGAYWDKAKRRLYIFPLPMLGVMVDLSNCSTIGHKWEMQGGRPCPWNFDGHCTQSVYRCLRCGDYDYGEESGPGAVECREWCGPKISTVEEACAAVNELKEEVYGRKDED